MPRRSRKKGGADEEDPNEISVIESSNFDDDSSLHLSDLDLDLDTETMNDQSQNTTMESIHPFENQPINASFDQESQGSLHLSDLDTTTNNNTSVNTTQESIGGKKRKTAKKRRSIQKKNSTSKRKKNKNNKKSMNKNKKNKGSISKRKKNKRGGQQESLETSLKKSEKQILPQHENPGY